MRTYKIIASLVFMVFLLGIGLGYTSAKNSCFDSGDPIAARNLNVQKAFVKNPAANADDDLVAIDYSIELNKIGQKYITGNCGNSKSGTFAIGELNFEELLPSGFEFQQVKMDGMASSELVNPTTENDGTAIYYEKQTVNTQQKVLLHFPHLIEFVPVRAGNGNGAIKSWNAETVRFDATGQEISRTTGNTLKWRVVLRTASKPGLVTFKSDQAVFNSTASMTKKMQRPNGNAWGYCKFANHKKCTTESALIEYETPFTALSLRLYDRPTISASRSDLYVNERSLYTFKWSESFANTKSTFTTETSYLTLSTPSNTPEKVTASLTGIQPKESSPINLTTVFSDFKKIDGTSISLPHVIPIAVKLPKIVISGTFADALKTEIKVNQPENLTFRLVTQDNQMFTPYKDFTYTVTSSVPSALPVTSPTNSMSIPLNAQASVNEVTVRIGLKDFPGSTAEKKLKIVEDGLVLNASELKVQVNSQVSPTYWFQDQTGTNKEPAWFSGYSLTIESGDTSAIKINLDTANRPTISGLSRGKVYVRLTALETVAVDKDNDPKTPAVNEIRPKQINGSDLSVRFKVLVYEDPAQINTTDLY